ncbi:hypothetical protein SAMN04489737_1720 [Arcanobacterium phocae]|uniref:Uncharacterized protein n=1 Tax=Arcanobacterium phocae TaxID=131112 RepID=A0A1H2LNQ6_9ACTO|nr:hypothetical protein SAMN04489737_1720 [Arcanobacterium phocae]
MWEIPKSLQIGVIRIVLVASTFNMPLASAVTFLNEEQLPSLALSGTCVLISERGRLGSIGGGANLGSSIDSSNAWRRILSCVCTRMRADQD